MPWLSGYRRGSDPANRRDRLGARRRRPRKAAPPSRNEPERSARRARRCRPPPAPGAGDVRSPRRRGRFRARRFLRRSMDVPSADSPWRPRSHRLPRPSRRRDVRRSDAFRRRARRPSRSPCSTRSSAQRSRGPRRMSATKRRLSRRLLRAGPHGEPSRPRRSSRASASPASTLASFEPLFERGRTRARTPPVRRDARPGATAGGVPGVLVLRALRAAFPNADARAAEGVALIDDAELHLDGTARRGLMGALAAALPNVQWIVTTSSA